MKKSESSELIALLREQKLTLATAESLTGGMAAAALTEVPGASEVFRQGFVTYCNRAKRKMLGVKKNTLKKHGAVSAQTAKEMAKYGAALAGTDACLSFTGNAGPSAEEEKPVGLVYIACCIHGKTTVRECHFEGGRAAIRKASVQYGFALLRECLQEEK